MLGYRLTRRSAQEEDRWRHREESMRLLRWGVELAVDHDQGKAKVGVVVLSSLMGSPLLDIDDIELVVSVTRSIAKRDLDDSDAP